MKIIIIIAVKRNSIKKEVNNNCNKKSEIKLEFRKEEEDKENTGKKHNKMAVSIRNTVGEKKWVRNCEFDNKKNEKMGKRRGGSIHRIKKQNKTKTYGKYLKFFIFKLKKAALQQWLLLRQNLKLKVFQVLLKRKFDASQTLPSSTGQS